MLARHAATVQYVDYCVYELLESELELRHLRNFRAVAEELRLARAAARAGMAQPPLGEQIRALEAEMGVALFQRVGRRVALTEAGETFMEDACAILDRVDVATLRAQQVSRGEAGKLKLGITEPASFSPVVTGLLAEWRVRWPSILMTLLEAHTPVLIGKLQTGELDGAFIQSPLTDAGGLAFRKLASEKLMVAVPIRHHLAGRYEVKLAELADESFVIYPRDTSRGLSDAIVAAYLRAGFMPRITQEAPQLSSTVNFVAASLGIAVLPECMRHLRPESVRFLRLLDEQPYTALGLVTSEVNRSPSLNNLRQMADEIRPIRNEDPNTPED